MIQASIYFNGDDCFLTWKMPKLQNCWGFAIYRKLVLKDGTIKEGFLHNRTGFEGDNNPPNSHKSSEKWPFQRYTWTDHSVSEGDTVTYTIYPVLNSSGNLTTDKNSGLVVGPIQTSSAGSGKAYVYFNRGLVMSQFMAKYMKENYGEDWGTGDLQKMKNSLKKDDSELRNFLMGDLGAKLLDLLKTAKEKKWHIYAALYELDDEALIDALIDIGKKAHIILANGSVKKKGEDGNKKAAALLEGKVDLKRRMLWSEGLGHNKFVVFAKSPTEPFMVWTGSTNWATTGLCTQLNNGILIEDKGIADVFKKHWQLLKNDKRTGRNGRTDMHFGEDLMESNDQMKSGSAGNTGKYNVWFTRTSEGQDLEFVTELINNAKEAILFLMFEPGNNGLLQVIQSRLSPASKTYDENLYVHGVVNSIKAGKKDMSVELVGRGENKPFDLKLVQPEGVTGLADWAKEVTRSEFIMQKDPKTGKMGVIGHAIIHSKMIILDPFTNPIVITGSHNFSTSASTKNDENMIIIKGNKELAQRYCVNIMSSYHHYRWRAYLKQCYDKNVEPWQGLKKSDAWQNLDVNKDKELNFWVR